MKRLKLIVPGCRDKIQFARVLSETDHTWTLQTTAGKVVISKATGWEKDHLSSKLDARLAKGAIRSDQFNYSHKKAKEKFLERVLPRVQEIENGILNKRLRREFWDAFKISLYKKGRIGHDQMLKWCGPAGVF